MVERMSVARTGAMICASLALAGCLGSGGGSGNGGGGGGGGGGQNEGIRPELNAARAHLVDMGGTPNVREAGTASYAGQAMFDLREVASGSPIVGEARADVNLQVDFGAQNNPITGGMTNLRGSLHGEDYALDSTHTLPVTSSMITRIDLDPGNPDLPPGVGDALAGVPGVGDLEPGGPTMTFSGTTTVDGRTGSTNLVLSGGFYGPNENAIIADGGGMLFIGGEGAFSATGGLFAERPD